MVKRGIYLLAKVFILQKLAQIDKKNSVYEYILLDVYIIGLVILFLLFNVGYTKVFSTKKLSIFLFFEIFNFLYKNHVYHQFTTFMWYICLLITQKALPETIRVRIPYCIWHNQSLNTTIHCARCIQQEIIKSLELGAYKLFGWAFSNILFNI